jgi:hypothetical protein
MKKQFFLNEEERKILFKRGGLEDALGKLGSLLLATLIIAMVIMVIYFGKPMLEGYQYSSQLSAIISGLNSYASNYRKYPYGSGWDWNTDYAYISRDILESGWDYQCQDNKITITSPQLLNPKVLERVKGSATSQCDEVKVEGKRVECILYNKPCWSETEESGSSSGGSTSP